LQVQLTLTPREDEYMTTLLDAGVAIYVAMTTALIVWIGVFLFCCG
jgi:hypothetical protein